MQAQTINAKALRETGMAALQADDALTARRHFEQLVAMNQADAAVWCALAMACQKLGDNAAVLAAVDRALAIDQRNLTALIIKGDYLVTAGDARAAGSYYSAAVSLAARVANLPPTLAGAVRRAEAARDRINQSIEGHLRQQLAAMGYDEKRSSNRFTHSLDLLSGKKQPYYQQPRAYLFPELPHIQFYPRETFAWLDAIEAATDDICAELLRVLDRRDAFVPYIQSSASGPARPHSLLNSPDWGAFFLWKDGVAVPENARQCPRTLAALAEAPLARIRGRTPSILFSLLKPGAHIEPHNGFLNSRLICHLPLIVPPGCRLRVGNDVREWQKGKAWAFDDTIEHEAWNSSNELRVVLIFDIWRPELTEEERVLVTALLEAIDTYDGTASPTWSD